MRGAQIQKQPSKQFKEPVLLCQRIQRRGWRSLRKEEGQLGKNLQEPGGQGPDEVSDLWYRARRKSAADCVQPGRVWVSSVLLKAVSSEERKALRDGLLCQFSGEAALANPRFTSNQETASGTLFGAPKCLAENLQLLLSSDEDGWRGSRFHVGSPSMRRRPRDRGGLNTNRQGTILSHSPQFVGARVRSLEDVQCLGVQEGLWDERGRTCRAIQTIIRVNCARALILARPY